MKDSHVNVPRKLRIEQLVPGHWACNGTVAVRALPRLAGLCTADVGAENVAVVLQAVHTPAGRTGLAGTLSGRVPLRCERCLGVFWWSFDLPIALYFAPATATGVEADGDFEACEAEDGEWLELWSLLEDEILLTIPIAPRHAAGACRTPALAV
ncbi:MAG: hypothetical protein EPN72_06465 [Nevskiaceae bacterium]|nr:MAG: hypothetical protein EPN63_10165 [Nevskiaceae bacterium]TBR73326.1 MAG: hypothetical protein EPN72_06465 [Nevskiaceae bacterium]